MPSLSMKDLQRFLGMINYLSTYVPNLTAKTMVLRQLLKKDSYWEWDENYESAFKTVKHCIMKASVLAYFDPSIPLTIFANVS